MTMESTAPGQTAQLGEVADEVRDRVSEAQSKVREQALDMADKRKADFAERGRTMLSEGEKIASTLREDGMATPAKYVDSAARELQGLIDYIDATPLDQMFREARTKASRRPFTYLGAAFALGFASTRLLGAGLDEHDSMSDIDGGYTAYASSDMSPDVSVGR